MKKFLTLLCTLTTALSLAACDGTGTGDPNKNPSGNDDPTNQTVEAKTYVASREDNREAVYVHYSQDGTEIDSYTSLYQAINACVNDGDIKDYITQKGKEEKLFENNEKYTEDTQDMYWYYDNGNSLNRYIYWETDYWNLLKNSNQISVFKAAANGTVSHYAAGYKAVKVNKDPTLFRIGQVMPYHVNWELEANATVDMLAYSGITKSVYHLDLSEAKIVPTYDGTDTAYAYVGFVTTDAYNVSAHGLRCDTTTGNWYYYCGEIEENVSNIVEESDNCYLTSTWDENEKCFRPDGDIVLTMELLTLVDEDGDDYIVHRLTMDFGNNRVVVKDYETADLTQCGTIRFTSGIDIVSDNTLVDYMCGAEFKNVVVTKAEATVLEEMMDDFIYGNSAELYPGVYDILNSNPDTDARFHTIIYNPACVTYDFDTPNQDVYGYSFDIKPAQ